MNSAYSLRSRQRGFLLLEIILAVAIFTVGVLSLGRCLNNCLVAQRIQAQEERARAALANRMAEIQASPALPDEYKKTRLKGMYDGVTLIERRKTVDVKNENNINLSGLHEITLTTEWTAPDGRTLARSVSFDLLRGAGEVY